MKLTELPLPLAFPGAQIRAEERGLFRATVDGATEIEAHIDIYEPSRRLRLIYLPPKALPLTEAPPRGRFHPGRPRT